MSKEGKGGAGTGKADAAMSVANVIEIRARSRSIAWDMKVTFVVREK